MSYSGSGNGTPHDEQAFDPTTEPDLFRSVLTRRVIAFIIDLIILTVPVALAYVFIAIFGLITLGLGWVLFWLVWPATVIWCRRAVNPGEVHQRRAAEKLNAKWHELDTGHYPMLSMPEELTVLLTADE